MTDPEESVFAQFALYRLDPAFRRFSQDHRQAAALDLQQTLGGHEAVRTYAYTTLGLKAGVDMVLWRVAHDLEALQEQSAAAARTPMGSYLEMTHSLLGMTRPSQYVRSRSLQEQSLFSQERNRYLVIYPFTKTVEWYLLNQEERQEQMTAHIRVGHRYPGVRQSLLYSFGIDDQEFVVSYEMDDLSQFQQLVIDLRATEARRHTLNDTPIFTCVHRSLGDALELIS